jgi:hypothetical protein
MKIKNEYWNKPVLNPIIRTLNPIQPDKVTNANVIINSSGFKIDWQPVENARKYAIYRNYGTVNHNDPSQLIGVVGVSPTNNLAVIDDKVDSNLDYNYAIVPLSGTNHKGDPFIFNTKTSRPVDPIPDFAIMENIWLTGPVLRNQEFSIKWNKGIVNIGSDLVYELQTSSNQLIWTTVTDGRLTTSQNVYSYYLTNPFTNSPIYYRVRAKNEIGEIITNTLKVTPDISMGDIWLAGSTLPNGQYSINWDEGVVKDNKTLTYELQSSFDQLTWIPVEDGQLIKSGTTYAHYLTYPDTSLPIYYRLIAKNEIGELVTNTLKVFPDITMEEIWISGTSLPNKEYRINWNKGIVNKGSELTYVLQSSNDQIAWAVVTEDRLTTSGNTISQYLIYPATTKPIYYRVIAINDIGKIVSNTVKVVPSVTNINECIDLTVSLLNDRIKKVYTR